MVAPSYVCHKLHKRSMSSKRRIIVPQKNLLSSITIIVTHFCHPKPLSKFPGLSSCPTLVSRRHPHWVLKQHSINKKTPKRNRCLKLIILLFGFLLPFVQSTISFRPINNLCDLRNTSAVSSVPSICTWRPLVSSLQQYCSIVPNHCQKSNLLLFKLPFSSNQQPPQLKCCVISTIASTLF